MILVFGHVFLVLLWDNVGNISGFGYRYELSKHVVVSVDILSFIMCKQFVFNGYVYELR